MEQRQQRVQRTGIDLADDDFNEFDFVRFHPILDV